MKYRRYDWQRQGMDPDAAQRKLVAASACEICGSKECLVPDHDHNTGGIRGVLCFSCNRALGQFKDSPALLLAAQQYLAGL